MQYLRCSHRSFPLPGFGGTRSAPVTGEHNRLGMSFGSAESVSFPADIISVSTETVNEEPARGQDYSFVDIVRTLCYVVCTKGGIFMSQTTLNVRMDEDVKRRFDEFCADVGMNASVAVNLFVKTVIRERRIPFEITSDPDPFYSESNVRELIEVD